MWQPAAIGRIGVSTVFVDVQLHSASNLDHRSLPTIVTRNEARTVLAWLPPDSHIRCTVMVPIENGQSIFATARLEASIRQVETARQEVANLEQVLEHLEYEADDDPTNAEVRDELAHTIAHIELLRYIVHFGEAMIASVPRHQGQQGARTQGPDHPPPHTP
jgi:hypothetical protein